MTLATSGGSGSFTNFCLGFPFSAADDGLVRLWFYVENWNARMKFTASECSLEWT